MSSILFPGNEPESEQVQERSHHPGGAESNARLTAMTAAVLVALLAVEGLTILHVRALLTLHIFIGMLLIPPVLLKMGSTIWRFARYYLGVPDYRRKGPPLPLFRILGPVVIILTGCVFATGIALFLGPNAWRSQMLVLHRDSFIVWFVVMAIHVLGHLGETVKIAPRDWMRRTRHQVDGASARQWALAGSLALGLVLALIVVPHIGPWLSAGRHARDRGPPAPIMATSIIEEDLDTLDEPVVRGGARRTRPGRAKHRRRRLIAASTMVLTALLIWLAISLGGALPIRHWALRSVLGSLSGPANTGATAS